MKFIELKWEGNAVEGIQAWVEVNGYEVSIVRNELSYGGKRGLYEIGVYKAGTEKMADPLGWGDTVKGWLTPSGVEKELELIGAL